MANIVLTSERVSKDDLFAIFICNFLEQEKNNNVNKLFNYKNYRFCHGIQQSWLELNYGSNILNEEYDNFAVTLIPHYIDFEYNNDFDLFAKIIDSIYQLTIPFNNSIYSKNSNSYNFKAIHYVWLVFGVDFSFNKKTMGIMRDSVDNLVLAYFEYLSSNYEMSKINKLFTESFLRKISFIQYPLERRNFNIKEEVVFDVIPYKEKKYS